MLIAPGVSFNVPYRTHFRITNLPDAKTLREVFARIEELLCAYAARPQAQPSNGAAGGHAVQVIQDRHTVKTRFCTGSPAI